VTAVLDPVIEPFRSGIGQRALLEVVLLGLVCGPLGVWVLLLRQAYAAESLAHAMLPGLVLAAVAGLPLVLGAVGGLLLGAGLIALAARDERIGGDLGVAVTITALTGAGALLALVPDTPARLQDQLFGDLLGVEDVDLVVAAVAAAGGLAVLGAAHRGLAVTAFDRGSAGALGVRAGRLELLLLVVLALTIVAAVRGLGSLLVVALVLAPAAAALRAGRPLPVTLALAAGLGVAAGVGGLELTYHASIAAGASVALVAVALFVLSLLAGQATGAGGAPAAHGGAGGPVSALGEVR
jgi:ABC-type Mn2+/Zn2+ transport system permease subunit